MMRPVSDFEDRCQRALDVVQRDLAATGHSQFVMRPRDLGGDEVFAALPDGRSWSGGGTGGMVPGMSDKSLLWHAATSVSHTLWEVLSITWPLCPSHGLPMAPASAEDVPGLTGPPMWWCDAGEHVVAPVGELEGTT